MSYMNKFRANAANTALSRLNEARVELARGNPELADLLIKQAIAWLGDAFDIGPRGDALDEVAAGLKAEKAPEAAGEPL